MPHRMGLGMLAEAPVDSDEPTAVKPTAPPAPTASPAPALAPESGRPIDNEATAKAFRAIFEHAPNGLLLVDAAGDIAAANARLLDMFGYEADEILGQRIEMLLPQRYRGGHVGLRDAYRHAPATRPMGKGRDLTGLRSDGREFPLEIGLSTVEIDGASLVCAAIVDITERKRHELRLREANAQLEEFTYVASHDLRSPIRGIATLLEFVREDFGDAAPPEVVRNLDRMGERIVRMEKLIADLLTYARAGRRATLTEPVDIHSIVHEILALDTIPPGFHVTVDAADTEFEGVRTPLATVLRNLIANAVNHHDRDDGQIAVRAWLEPDQCVIEVGDDGPGIPEAAQARVFRLFQTLDSSRAKGSGLGLAVVQRLVEGHGGRIHLESHDGTRGSTFRVLWPRYARSDFDE